MAHIHRTGVLRRSFSEREAETTLCWVMLSVNMAGLSITSDRLLGILVGDYLN